MAHPVIGGLAGRLGRRCFGVGPAGQVTVELPQVKAKLQAALLAEGLDFSDWVPAQAAGHVTDAATAYDRGRTASHKAGEKAGYRRGRQDGEAAGRSGGFVAEPPAPHLPGLKKRAIVPEGLADDLLKHAEQRAIAAAVPKERGHARERARRLRRVRAADA